MGLRVGARASRAMLGSPKRREVRLLYSETALKHETGTPPRAPAAPQRAADTENRAFSVRGVRAYRVCRIRILYR